MDFQPLPEDSPDLAGYARPELMAIGDSIYNGTRSLSTTPGLARLAAPALVARGLGINDFRTPDYPRPVLFDLEAHLREGLDPKRLRQECLQNAERWFDGNGVWSAQRFFDNISIASAAYGDLSTNTSGALKVRAQAAFRKLSQSSDTDYGTMLDLYYGINGGFLLNPSGDSDLDDLTPLEQVASRKPKRLLVNIGSNEGLFMAGLTTSWSRDAEAEIARIPGLAAHLGDQLAQHCGDVEHIYFNLLIRPRVLGNLAPRTDEEMYVTPPGGGYFRQYVGRLGSLNGMSATQMAAFDDAIARVNDETRTVLTGLLGDRIRFVDLYAWAAGHDRKHGTETEPLWVRRGSGDRRISNFPFSSLAGFRQGGLFSLDNMHPTTVGYALLANAVGEVIAETEGVPFTPLGTQDAYDADTLLQDPPESWDFIVGLASLAAAFLRA